jgi:hypothetical protein
VNSDTALPYSRRANILRLLAEHGPISIRGLKAILEPRIDPRNLRVALQRLGKYGFVTKKNDRLFGGSGIYYEITRDSKVYNQLVELELLPKNLPAPPRIHRPYMIHSECCAIWTELFRRYYKEGQTLRDINLDESAVALRKLLSSRNDFELRPDLLLLLPTKDGNETRSVAFEIERSMKSAQRIIMKLKKYANETLLDGVVYVCEDGAVAERIRQIYRSKVLNDTLRIKRYNENFLLFSDPTNSSSANEPKVWNTRGQLISMHYWIQKLQTTRREERRNSSFKLISSDRYKLDELEKIKSR